MIRSCGDCLRFESNETLWGKCTKTGERECIISRCKDYATRTTEEQRIESKGW